MPKTFADAVPVTLHLGIQYLWIDSLCILQDKDDLSDWSPEAGLMHQVYSISYCNISAAVAENCTQGLSRNRDPERLYGPSVRVQRTAYNDATADRYVDCEVEDLDLWTRNVSECSLYEHGWVIFPIPTCSSCCASRTVQNPLRRSGLGQSLNYFLSHVRTC